MQLAMAQQMMALAHEVQSPARTYVTMRSATTVLLATRPAVRAQRSRALRSKPVTTELPLQNAAAQAQMVWVSQRWVKQPPRTRRHKVAHKRSYYPHAANGARSLQSATKTF